MIEACHKKLEGAPDDLPEEERRRRLEEAAREVTPAIFFSLLIVAAAFLPVFGLEGQAGKLFKPLAYTKTFVMLTAAVLSVTLAPALRDLLLKGKTYPEHDHPVSRAILKVYKPFVYVALRRPMTTVLIGVLMVLSAVPPALKLGSEFMPELDEGDLLYMPTTLPGISIEEAKRQLQRQDEILRGFAEVLSVHGKTGRAETPTDPAPLSMVETVIRLKPREQWPLKPRARWYSSWAPAPLAALLRPLWPDRAPDRRDELVARMDEALQLPGWKNAWTMPIRNRIDMLSTGIRTPVGVKVFARKAEGDRRGGRGPRAASLAPARGAPRHLRAHPGAGSYVDVTPRPEALARHGLRVDDVNTLVEGAIGGTTLSTAVEGRARYPITARFSEDFRSSVEQIRALPLPIPPPMGPALARRRARRPRRPGGPCAAGRGGRRGRRPGALDAPQRGGVAGGLCLCRPRPARRRGRLRRAGAEGGRRGQGAGRAALARGGLPALVGSVRAARPNARAHEAAGAGRPGHHRGAALPANFAASSR